MALPFTVIQTNQEFLILAIHQECSASNSVNSMTASLRSWIDVDAGYDSKPLIPSSGEADAA
jgi:hypothetical protein